MGESRFRMQTWKSGISTVNGPYTDLPSFKIYLWMPSMGHGSSPVSIKKLASGDYEVNNVFFIMGGRWELRFNILKNNEVVDEVILPYTI